MAIDILYIYVKRAMNLLYSKHANESERKFAVDKLRTFDWENKWWCFLATTTAAATLKEREQNFIDGEENISE